MGDLGQDAVDASAHGDGILPGLDVQVACGEADGILDQAVDQATEIRSGLSRAAKNPCQLVEIAHPSQVGGDVGRGLED